MKEVQPLDGEFVWLIFLSSRMLFELVGVEFSQAERTDAAQVNHRPKGYKRSPQKIDPQPASPLTLTIVCQAHR